MPRTPGASYAALPAQAYGLTPERKAQMDQVAALLYRIQTPGATAAAAAPPTAMTAATPARQAASVAAADTVRLISYLWVLPMVFGV